MTKSIEDNFSDWEADVFGFGYGTGEPHTVPALRKFFELCVPNAEGTSRSYDYRQLETELTPPVAWMLINTLCHADIIEYGTSPRFGWLTGRGDRLCAFVLSKTEDELVLLTCRDSDYGPCYPDACNCGPDGYQAGVKCDNPFWSDKR